MPDPAVDLVTVAALGALLAVAFIHPRGRTEALAGLTAATVVMLVGAVSWDEAATQVERLLPVVLFLSASLVVAEMCAAEGLFAALGDAVRRGGRSSPRRLLLLTVAAASVVTATLSLDATVVLLTPVVVAAAAGSAAHRPLAHACVRLANSASLLLPVSNLTNLLALPDVDLTFVQWVLVMAPVWLSVIAVEYAGLRLFFRGDLHGTVTPPARSPVPVRRAPVVVVALMLVGFVAGSPWGVEPFWVAGAAAVALTALARHDHRVTWARVGHATHLPFAFFVLCLGVVVAGLTESFLGDLVRDVAPSGTGLLALLGIAALATLLANAVNNLPATLLLVPLVAPLGTTAVLAALIGLNVGSGLTYPGSLANLLWRRVLVRLHDAPSARTFHAHALLVTPVAVVTGVVVLWALPR